MTAGEGLDLLQTPAFRAVTRLLMERGTWVARAEFDALGHLPGPLENALADVVMLGQVEYRGGAGYRLAQAPVVRAAVRGLLERPELERHVQMRQGEGGVHVGMALRRGPDVLDVAMAGVVVPEPDGATDAECLSLAAALPARLWRSMEAVGVRDA